MERREFTLDRFTRCMLLAITCLLTVIAVELWVGRPSMLPAARAQIPDPGRQRNEIVGETRRTNELLLQILNHLRTQPIKVELKATDEQKGLRRAPRPAAGR